MVKAVDGYAVISKPQFPEIFFPELSVPAYRRQIGFILGLDLNFSIPQLFPQILVLFALLLVDLLGIVQDTFCDSISQLIHHIRIHIVGAPDVIVKLR